MAYGDKIESILYGGDYNPEQWPEEIWEKDMEMIKKANITIVTLNVFSWASIQPNEDTYNFDKLDKIMRIVKDNGLKVCMATSTGAHPAWMAKKHPDILRTGADGIKRKFGGRHNSCPNSITYRYYATKLAGELAKRYKDYDNIVAWHISNEFGGECYCENCENAFREWLKKKYKTVEAMNKSFNTTFWGHTFYDWDEVVLPNYLSEHFGEERTMFQGISLDYRRFNSDSMLQCFIEERDAIKKYTPDIPVTTNLMGFYKSLDYHKWAKEMDFVSWDNYPMPEEDPASVAMSHDLMRGIGKQNSFVLMEQTPSVTNWQPYNKLKRPGELRLQSYQAIAHGADAIQFFQIRRSIGACEKFHGAVIEHAGRDDTRVFKEVSQLGKELGNTESLLLKGRTPSQVAIVFDWDNWWAVEYSAGPSIRMKYIDAVKDYYKAAFNQNVPVDIISVDDNMDRYKVVIAPLIYMTKQGFDEKVRSFVERGGIFITTYFSGIVDEHDLVILGGYPGKLKDILGIWVEENDALPDGEYNQFSYNGNEYQAGVLCDIIHLEGAKTVSVYEKDFYKNTPVLTENNLGKGKAYYVGTRSSREFYEEFMKDVFTKFGIKRVAHTPKGVEATIRENRHGQFLFLLNHNEQPSKVILRNDCRDVITGMEYSKGEEITMEKYDVYILKQRK